MRRDRFTEDKGIKRIVVIHPNTFKKRRTLIKLKLKSLAKYKKLGWNLYPDHKNRQLKKYKKHIFD